MTDGNPLANNRNDSIPLPLSQLWAIVTVICAADCIKVSPTIVT
jgi:hypothetical protein